MGNYATERDAERALIRLVIDRFTLIPQARLRLIDGRRRRMDYLAVPDAPEGFPVPWVGIECKYGYGGFRDFTAALVQAIEYRHATVIDPRCIEYVGQQPPFVFLFPMLDGTASSEGEPASIYAGWAGGALRLAGKFNVGVIRTRPTFGIHSQPSPYYFEVGADRLWDSQWGMRGRGEVYGTGRKRGLG